MIREGMGVRVSARGNRVLIEGEGGGARAAQSVIRQLMEASERGRPMGRSQVLERIAEANWRRESGEPEDGWGSVGDGFGDGGGVAGPGWGAGRVGGRSSRGEGGRVHSSHEGGGEGGGDRGGDEGGRLDVRVNGRPLVARTPNQRAYIRSIFENDLVFGIGPAGTGKTFLAVAAAVHQLKTGRVRRAVLARPAVEAGEKLGFLPGDLMEKVNPYLRPLFDALGDMLDYETVRRFMSSDVIEVVPLAFMRGRTLNDSVIILDEAQNTTKSQMQMFLTRMGQRSTMIVTGDVTQIDLEDPRESGLIDAARRLRRVKGVGVSILEGRDVVRHDLVQRVIEAYSSDEEHDERSTAEVLAALAGGERFADASGGEGAADG